MKKNLAGETRGRPTTRDVAHLAGVSLGTVSRVLNDVPNVRPEIRQRVDAAIRQLNFVPHAFAQGLRSKTTKTVACIVSNITLPLFSKHVAGIESVLQGHGYSLLLMNTHSDPAREREIYAFVDRQRIDGIITTLTNEGDQVFLEQLRSARIPIVLLERDVDGFDRVLADHRSGVERATAHLLGLGHRRISLITVSAANWPGRERRAGFEKAFAAANVPLPDDLIVTYGATADYGYHAAHQLLLAAQRPTAFIVGANQIIGVVKALKLAGLRIPDEISLIGLGNTEFGEVFSPPITEVRWRIEALGEIAASILVDRLSGLQSGQTAPQRVLLATELVTRGSCGPALKR